MDSVNERKVFKQFVYAERLAFSEILRKTKIPSNLLAYFLKKMVDKGVLQKSSAGLYALSNKGEKLLPFYTEAESITPLVVILIMVVEKNKVLLLKRKRRPYRGLWSIISGRMLLGESISEAAERVCVQKLGIRCTFEKISAVVHERLVENEAKHSFVFFVVRAGMNAVPNFKLSSTDGDLKWFSLSTLPKKGIIASDYWLLKNRLSSKTEVVEEILEKSGKKLKLVN